MKFKKDVPRKYRKYVRWQVYDSCDWPLNGLYERKREAISTWYWENKRGAVTIRPILCLPLSLLHVQGEPGHEELFTAPLVYDKPKENA